MIREHELSGGIGRGELDASVGGVGDPGRLHAPRVLRRGLGREVLREVQHGHAVAPQSSSGLDATHVTPDEDEEGLRPLPG